MSRFRFMPWLGRKLLWALVRLLIAIAYGFSDRNRFRLGTGIGRVIYFFSKERSRKAAVMCSRLLNVESDEACEIIRQSYLNIGRGLIEILAFSREDRSVFEHRIDVHGLDYLDDALARKRGVLLLSAHIGNWEMAAAWLGKRGYPMNVIGARQPPDPAFTELFDRIRQASGVRTVWKDSFLRPAVSCLKNNQILGVLLDQIGDPKGAIVPLLGVPAETVTGPVRLAQSTGSLILPILATRCRDNPLHHTLTFFPFWEVPPGNHDTIIQHTRMCNDLISSWIRQYPEQWLYQGWLCDRWIFDHPEE